jgi:hypothetical protein
MTDNRKTLYIGVVVLLVILYFLWLKIGSVSDDYYDLEDRINTLELELDQLEWEAAHQSN